MIHVAGIKLKEKTLHKRYGEKAICIDVTSKAEPDYIGLSPFFPHGDIPVPFSDGITGCSVEGIWQGLKVFNNHDVDMDTIKKTTMKNIKRTIRAFGYPKGHRKGINGEELLDYFEARILIYLPIYKWVLDNKCQDALVQIKKQAETNDVVLLDYATNGNLFLPNKPLSHAALIKFYLEDRYPDSKELIERYHKDPDIVNKEVERIKSEKQHKSQGSNPNQTSLDF